METDNLVLNVTFHQNSNQYSGILNHLVSFSPSTGIPAFQDKMLFDNTYTNVYFYEKHTKKPVHFRVLYNLIIDANESNDPEGTLIESLKDFVDMDGVPVFKSKYKLFLPRSINYKPIKDSKLTLLNANYNKNRYIGLMEHLQNYRAWVFESFDYNISLETIDNAINEEIEDGYIDLRESSNYCKSIIEFFIKRSNKKLDLEKTLNYFMGKPVALLRLAAIDGIEYAMDNGYEEYKDLLIGSYKDNIQHKENTTSIQMKTLMLPIRELSQIAYEKLYSQCGLEKNDDRFFEWHQWMFEGDKFMDETSVEALANIISKVMTGQPFDKQRWNMGMSVILDFALKEKQDIDNGLQTYPLYKC